MHLSQEYSLIEIIFFIFIIILTLSPNIFRSKLLSNFMFSFEFFSIYAGIKVNRVQEIMPQETKYLSETNTFSETSIFL